MNKAYSRIGWENSPSAKTPLNETNMNIMDAGINELDNRIITLDTTKATKLEISTLFSDILWDESTGVLTLVRLNGSSIRIDTKLEKMAVNFVYDETNERLVLTLIDGTTQYIDLKALITQYDFIDSDTIALTVTDGKVQAHIKRGSITGDMLDPNYLAEIVVQVESAAASAVAARQSADAAAVSEEVAGTHSVAAQEFAEQSDFSKEESKRYAEMAQAANAEITKKLQLAEFDVDDEGNLIYSDDSAYRFNVDDEGYLNYSIE